MAIQELSGFRRVQVNWGDTLQRLAARELGDASRWTEIASINRLAPPYLSAEGSGDGRVARYGDTIVVPDVRRELRPIAVSDDEVFGVDVLLQGGRLDVQDGDLSVVAGRTNLRQALSHRVRVERGELIFHQTYGCEVHRLKGDRNTSVAALLGALFVRQAVERDERVAYVRVAESNPSGDTLGIEIEAETVTGHPVEVRAEL